MCQHISLLLPNRPGEFCRATKILDSASVNILGYQLTSQGNSGILHILCSDAEHAYRALFQEYRFYCNKSAVLICRAAHAPGALKEILAQLEQHELNIENSYQATTSDGEVIVVFELIDKDQTQAAEAALIEAGVAVLEVQPQ